MSNQIVITSIVIPLNTQGWMANSMPVAQRFKLRLEILPFHKKDAFKDNRNLSKGHGNQCKRAPTHKGF